MSDDPPEGELDPQVKVVLDAVAATGAPGLETMTPDEARAQYLLLTPMINGTPPDVAGATDSSFPGPGQNNDVPVRTYLPLSSENGLPPVLVFFHGGGWVVCDLDTHDGLCRRLAAWGGFAVVSVDYRLAPEHPFPAAVEDAFAAVKWVAENGAEVGVDGARLAVGGDSAGGNLAAVAAVMARDAGGPDICHQLLIYPGTDQTMTMPSIERLGTGYRLTRAGMEWFRGHYMGESADYTDPLASPLLARDFTGLPSAQVFTGEFDPLVDEGRAYAEKLRAAGVNVDDRCVAGMIHGYFNMAGIVERAAATVREAAEGVAKAF